MNSAQRGAMYATLVALICWLLASPVAADVITAVSCSESDVRAALNAVTAATTQVRIPAGTCHWSSAKMVLTLPKGIGNLSILGAGNLSVMGGGDVTTIIDDFQDGNDALWAIAEADTNRPRVIRIAGLTFRRGAGALKNGGFIKIAGMSPYRVDHNTFDTSGASMAVMYVWGATGVFDHNIANQFVSIHFSGTVGAIDVNGDQGWSEPTNFGGPNFFFVEDNQFGTFGGFSGQGSMADCTHAARVVVRYNTGNDTMQHGTYGGTYRARGCRAVEIYGNRFNGGWQKPIELKSGSALIWGNTQIQPAGGQYWGFITAHQPRRNNSSSVWNYPPPAGWGYCGTSFSGTGSNWDQNADPPTGYPCLDQVGRGPGDLLANDFGPTMINVATRCNSSQPCASPRQALEPVYEWLNTTPFPVFTVYEGDVIQANRDYYAYTASFTGASGVGSGLLANRPTTCTPKVVYWATDTKTLYQCVVTNTWTSYYTPYRYPHPLVDGSEVSPLPLMNLGGARLSTSIALTPSPEATATPDPPVFSAVVSTTRPTSKSTGGQQDAATTPSTTTPVSSAAGASRSAADVRPTAAGSVTSPQGVGTQPNPATAPRRGATVSPSTPPAAADAGTIEPVRQESSLHRVAAIPPRADTRPTAITANPSAAGTTPQIVLGSAGPRRNRALPVTVTSDFQLTHVKVFIDDKLVLTLATTAMKLTFSQSLPNRKAVMVRVEATDAGGNRATERVAIPSANDAQSLAGDHGRSKASKPLGKE